MGRMTRRRLLAVLAALAGLAIPAIAFAAEGDPDTTYASGGVLTLPLGAADSGEGFFVRDPHAAVAPNGDLVVAAVVNPQGGDDGIRVLRRSAGGGAVDFGDPHGPGPEDDGVFVAGSAEIVAMHVLADGETLLLARLGL